MATVTVSDITCGSFHELQNSVFIIKLLDCLIRISHGPCKTVPCKGGGIGG